MLANTFVGAFLPDSSVPAMPGGGRVDDGEGVIPNGRLHTDKEIGTQLPTVAMDLAAYCDGVNF
jgi:hypothetical protein